MHEDQVYDPDDQGSEDDAANNPSNKAPAPAHRGLPNEMT